MKEETGEGGGMNIPSFTYSSINQFKTCPRQYEAHRVTKYVPYADTPATLYGTAVHLAAEKYIGEAEPLPEDFGYIKKTLDVLNAIPGERYCEMKLGITDTEEGLQACEYEAADRYWRGIADLVVINALARTAFVCDYKTGKSAKYADTTQLALIATALFLKFPAIERIKGALVFLKSNELVKYECLEKDKFKVFAKLNPLLAERSRAYRSGEFKPKPNGLCLKWCQATRCPHNGNHVPEEWEYQQLSKRTANALQEQEG